MIAIGRGSVITICLALAVVGCIGTPSSPTANSPGQPEEWDEYGLVPEHGPHRQMIFDVVRTSSAWPMSDRAVALNRDIFADGEVTYSEYERAVYAWAECMMDLGIELVGPFTAVIIAPGLDSSRTFGFHYLDPGVDLDEDIELCDSMSSRVEAVWLETLTPTQAEIEIWLDAAWECAAERGASLSDPPTVHEAIQAATPGVGCEPWAKLPPR